ncbi:Zinc finger CCHC domain-containing protein 8 [Trichinella pseudospiralis]|uniref:Zinc finger CCHC domain-containing protein 8 n=1 Tax=Trichinella pseudospiralis TaxID=6337 RepID=A0A0V1G0W6_TRIPS|nr:Zinc finger CCHC domain-containing protein 8 [Trichinella pseudospiralis]
MFSEEIVREDEVVKPDNSENDENNSDDRNGNLEKSVSTEDVANNLFVVDKTPQAINLDDVPAEGGQGLLNASVLDFYCEEKEKDVSPSATQSTFSMRACFNCNETNHKVDNCPYPYNAERVQQMKQAFFNRTDDFSLNVPTKFRSYKPGIFSYSLQQALDMRDDQLPPYIYGMRLHGYPPGYWKCLVEEKRKLSFVNENDGITSENIETFDVDSVIKYPGFTTDTPLGIVDESSKYNLPKPQRKHHWKEIAIDAEREYYKNSKRSQENEKRSATKRKCTSESDVIDFTENKDGKNAVDERSMSLEELEKARNAILQKLETDFPEENQKKTSVDDGSVTLLDVEEQYEIGPSTSSATFSCGSDLNSSESSIKSSVGTPAMCHSFDYSFEKPSFEKFAVNIQPIVLPESTPSSQSLKFKSLVEQLKSRKNDLGLTTPEEQEQQQQQQQQKFVSYRSGAGGGGPFASYKCTTCH